MKKRKIKIVRITPNVNKEDLFNNNCFIAVSLNNPFFYGEKLKLLLEFISRKFDNCLIIIADVLYRYNIEIIEGLIGNEAIEKAKEIGKKSELEFISLIAEFEKKKFTINHWQDFTNNDSFSSTLMQLKQMYSNNQRFNKSICNTANEFITRLIRKSGELDTPIDKALQLSVEFILEEMAVYNIVSSKGYYVDIYPGTYLPILQDISLGKFSDAPEYLKRKINVEVKSVRIGKLKQSPAGNKV